MKEQDSFILDIKRLGINGEGIGYYHRKTVFVENAIPGEGHHIEITKAEDTMAFGKSIEIKHASPARIIPSCPYYSICAGCNTSHIHYEKMLELKREGLIEALTRYSGLNPRTFEIRPTIPSFNIFGYKNRSQLLVKQDQGSFMVAMPQPNSTQSVLIRDCLVQKPLISKLNQSILKLADELEIPPYIVKFNRGVLHYLVIRVNEQNEALVCFICAEKHPKIKELAKRVIQLEGVASVYESFNATKKNNAFSEEAPQLLEGKEYIVEKLDKITYRIYPNTFFMLNTSQTKNMLDVVLKACKLSRRETVLDAYCGVGTISLYIAKMAKNVIGVECNKDSVEVAKQNALDNHIQNVTFSQGDIVKLLPSLMEKNTIDILIVNPPKTGLEHEFIEAILSANIKRMVYVSSNPATLAKNLKELSSFYKVSTITPIDMLPQTASTESVCSLVLRTDNK